MRLPRRQFAPRMSITSLIDLMLILLFFFMISSTYINLRMIPLVSAAGAGDVPGAAAAGAVALDRPDRLLIRLGADGAPALAGGRVDHPSLRRIVAERLARDPRGAVLVLPSGGASTQALVSLLDTLAAAGARDVRLVRLEAR